MERELRKIWMQYVMMYVGVALLVVLLLLPIYYTAYQQNRNGVLQETQYSLQKNVDRLETEMQAAEQYINSLLSSESVVHMAYLDDNNHYHLMLAMQLADSMLTTTAKQLYIDDVVLLFPGGKYVVSRGKVTSADNYYGKVIGYENYDQNTFEELLYQQRQAFFPMQPVTTSYYNRPVHAITLNYFGNTKRDTYVAACVVLTEERLVDTLVTNSVRNGGFMSVTDAQGYELLSYGVDGAQDAHYAVMRITGEKGMVYVDVGVPESIFQNSVSKVRHTIAIYIAVALTAAVIMSFVFGTRQYKPVRDYFRYVQSQGIDMQPMGRVAAVNHWMTISLNGLKFQRSSLLESVQQLKKNNRDILIQNLLHGISVQEKDVGYYLEDVQAISGSYLLLSIDIDGFHVSMAETENLYHEFESCLIDVFPGTYLLPRDVNVAILPISSKQLADAYDWITRLSEDLWRYGSLSCHVVCSALHEGKDELSIAYGEVRQLMRHIRVLESDNAFFQYDLIDEYTNGIKSSLYHSEDLIAIFQLGNEKHLWQWIEGFLQQMVELFLHNMQRATAQYYGIVSVLDDLSRKWQVAFTPRMLNLSNGYEPVTDYVRSSAAEILEAMARSLEQRDKKHEILKYIDSHYQQPDICLSLLADEFKLSETHISRIIKAETGKSYGAYIEDIRMARAKELLENSELAVKDISLHIGYDNQSTFMKAFKRVYHVPPTSFRQKSKK